MHSCASTQKLSCGTGQLTKLLVLLTLAWFACPLLRADNYDNMRTQWAAMVVGANNNMNDSDIAASVNQLASEANTYWSSMDTTPGAAYLWSDLSDFTNSATITSSYTRLEIMAKAYAQPGNSLQGNASLAQAVAYGLDWMYTNYYNQNTTMFGNWWDWQIGSAQPSMSAALLIYGQLSATEIANYTAAIDHFDPNPADNEDINGTPHAAVGANLTDTCLIVILRGILGKNSSDITTAESDLDPVYLYVTTGDGFYVDGSFIQHTHMAYTGSYGVVLLSDIANLFDLLNNSAWPITDSNASNVWNWVSQSYTPLMANGAMMDMVSGRSISRCGTWDHSTGRTVVADLARLALSASPSEASYLQGLVKEWITGDTTWNGYTNPCDGPDSVLPSSPVSITYSDYYSSLNPYDIANLEAVMANPSISAATQVTGNFNFASMDRVVHQRPGFVFGLSIFSNQIHDYECENGENYDGWYTGAGMTYLYTADLEQYDNNYWATVNPTRLSGVTSDGSTTTKCNGDVGTNTYTWGGGSAVDGLYGSSGLQFTLSPVTGSSLNGQKSWFWLANKMVALGSGINSTSSGNVETIADNRMIDANGDNALVVNGTTEPTTLGWSSTIPNVTWAYMDGNVANSGIGYYFPSGGASIYALRETRTGQWSTINQNGPTTSYSNNFMSLAFEHGSEPADAGYAYVVLPNQTSTSMAAYAANPDITVLENSTSAQAVYDSSIDAYGANFWSTTSHTVNDQKGKAFLTASQQASVTTVQNGTELDVAISDPTQANTGTITLTINRAASSVISADPQVTVNQLSPSVQLSVNVNAAAGKSFQVKLTMAPILTTLGDTADSYIQDGSSANTNFGTATQLYVKNAATGYNRISYLMFNLSTVTAHITQATVYLTPTSEGESGFTNDAYLVTNNSWTETGITWNNAPALSSTLLGSWQVPAVNTQASFDVTAAAQNAQANGGLLSVGVNSPTNVGSAGWVEYASKENGTQAYRPEIVVTTDTP